jgi:hypothetical protein
VWLSSGALVLATGLVLDEALAMAFLEMDWLRRAQAAGRIGAIKDRASARLAGKCLFLLESTARGGRWPGRKPLRAGGFFNPVCFTGLS